MSRRKVASNAMSKLTKEILEICEHLPEGKVAAIVDFARALQRGDESPADAAWERILAENRHRPKLEAFISAAVAESEPRPLDRSRL
jgi:hypothetical protein